MKMIRIEGDNCSRRCEFFQNRILKDICPLFNEEIVYHALEDPADTKSCFYICKTCLHLSINEFGHWKEFEINYNWIKFKQKMIHFINKLIGQNCEKNKSI
jgi:hypothetical protein